jgi:rsbT co-antagonist protein RsbR
MVPLGSGPPSNRGGWVILGVLNEVLLRLVNQVDLGSFWGEVAASVRWILRSQRLCVVLTDEHGGAQLAAACTGDVVDPSAPAARVVVDAWIISALSAQRAGFFKRPWGEARQVDPMRSWLLADDPEVVFHVPVQVYKRTIGTMLFALDDHGLVDRKALAAASTYALYVGATYTMLRSSQELLDAGERLREQNEELEQAHAELRRQLDVIRAQRDAMLVMSTPIIQVWDGVLSLPVIGAIDGDRAARMLEEVLSAVVRHEARFMVVDLTGAEATDASTVSNLLKIFSATKLLGSRCLLSGVPPAMVPHILEAGGSLEGTPVFSSLQRALEHVMRASGRKLR